MDLKYMTEEELRYGIERCRARLSGILPIGYMKTPDQVKAAMREYIMELNRRGRCEMDFK